jgi:hypothetical protein
MRGLEELVPLEPTDRAMVLIRSNDSFSEFRLVETLSKQSSGVTTPDVRLFNLYISQACKAPFVNTHRKSQMLRIVTDDVDGPFGCVQAWHDPMEVDKRHLALHRQSETDVLMMARIRAAIAVSQQTVVAKRVIVGTRLSLDDGNRRNTERNRLKHSWLEDTLRTH